MKKRITSFKKFKLLNLIDGPSKLHELNLHRNIITRDNLREFIFPKNLKDITLNYRRLKVLEYNEFNILEYFLNSIIFTPQEFEMVVN